MIMKKSMIALGLSIVMVLAMSISAFAYTHYNRYTARQLGYSFDEEWQITYVGADVKITMGFDTDWIDEDYCWTWSKYTKFPALVYNNKT